MSQSTEIYEASTHTVWFTLEAEKGLTSLISPRYDIPKAPNYGAFVDAQFALPKLSSLKCLRTIDHNDHYRPHLYLFALLFAGFGHFGQYAPQNWLFFVRPTMTKRVF